MFDFQMRTQSFHCKNDWRILKSLLKRRSMSYKNLQRRQSLLLLLTFFFLMPLKSEAIFWIRAFFKKKMFKRCFLYPSFGPYFDTGGRQKCGREDNWGSVWWAQGGELVKSEGNAQKRKWSTPKRNFSCFTNSFSSCEFSIHMCE